MGKDLYESSALAKNYLKKANDILGYRITDIMFNGTDEDLRQTKVTQPAVFLHSVISALCMGDDFQTWNDCRPFIGRVFGSCCSRSAQLWRRIKISILVQWLCRKHAKLLHRQWLPFWDWLTRKWKKSALQSKERFVCRAITTVRDKS